MSLSSLSSLSIIIPTIDNLLDKDCASISGNGPPLSADNSLWSLAVYEVWDSVYVYRDLKAMIEYLWEEIDCASFYMDFRKETRQKFEHQRLKVTEGVAMLYMSGEENKAYNLLPMLNILVGSSQKYDDMYSKVCEMYEEIYHRILQLQVDIQVCADKEMEFCDFIKEKKLIQAAMKKFKEIGGIEEEMRILNRLMEGVDIELWE